MRGWRAATRALLGRLRGEGVTVLLTSHDLADVERLADRLAILDRGRLLGCGTMSDLRKQASSDGNLEELFMKITEETAAEAADASAIKSAV